MKLPARRSGRHRARRCTEVPQRAPRVGGSAAGGGLETVEPQVLQDGEDAAVVVLIRRQSELGENGGDVLLDAALAELELLADRLVRAALGDQRKHFALAHAQRLQR